MESQLSDTNDNTIRVSLVKEAGEAGLGFNVAPSSRKLGGLHVTTLTPGGAAAKSGLVQPGDRLISINNVDVQGSTHEEVLKILKRCPAQKPVVLLLRGPEAHTTYLQTSFTESGSPRTVRITRPIGQTKRLQTEETVLMLSPSRIVYGNGTGPTGSSAPHVNGDIKNGHLTTNGVHSSEGSSDRSRPSSSSLSSDSLSPSPRDRSGSPSPRRMSSSPRGSLITGTNRYVTLKNFQEDKAYSDTLHTKAITNIHCKQDSCQGSLMYNTPTKAEYHSRGQMLLEAKDFLEQYFANIKKLNSDAHRRRWEEVHEAIEKNGTYHLTSAELTFGTKTAWRNAPRCIGRIQWSKLQVFDCRHITTARGMFEAICNHVRYGTNKGNIRSAITIFPPRTDGKHDFRVWSAQFIRYAGYEQPDGSIIGDPANVAFTKLCQKMGWKSKETRFDVLPLVLQANGADPEWFELPPDLILEVPLKHPKFPWFAEMGLRWYALPAVANMMFDCGGLQFTAAPFSGWYMSTEIGCRNLCDTYRFNITKEVAEKMGLDTRKSASLWRDRAMLEVNVAVLHSYQSAGVTISDHHSAAESFMTHVENENRLRGGCPADWVWIVPPLSGSLCPVFHLEMLNYKCKPSFEYQEDITETYVWSKDRESGHGSPKKKTRMTFKEVANGKPNSKTAVRFSANLMSKALSQRIRCTILYATETGKSERFARIVCDIFKSAFDPKVVCMEDYDITELEHETLVLVVTSTFGNGDPPENGESIGKALYKMMHPQHEKDKNKHKSLMRNGLLRSESRQALSSDRKNSQTSMDQVQSLANIRFSVFALGSRSYPNYCAFGHYIDHALGELGGERIMEIMEGDELCGQEQSFQSWAGQVFQAACETFCISVAATMKHVTSTLQQSDLSWASHKFRLTPVEGQQPKIDEALSKVHHKTVLPCKLISSENLQSSSSGRRTLLVKLDTGVNTDRLSYVPGDHAAIFPANRKEIVDIIISRLQNAPPADQVVKLEVLVEKNTPLGAMKSWMPDDRFPTFSLHTALTHFLDVTTPPTQKCLQQLLQFVVSTDERDKLDIISSHFEEYEEWKHMNYPNLADVLMEFPSLNIPPTLLLTQLPLLQQRFYSISSSPRMTPGEIHATVAVVNYRTKGGLGPIHHGVCSTWLDNCKVDDVIPVFVRSANTFHLPEDQTLPVVMVGPGTGIAPFRSFWQQRKIDMEMMPQPKGENKVGWGTMHLYFGCRNSKQDDIYKEETSAAKADGVLTEVHTALSREKNVPKKYVQDLLLEHGRQIYQLIVHEGGHFYVCGDVSMASDVSGTMQKILMMYGNMTAEEAKDQIVNLRENNQLHEDIFGVTLRTSEVQDRMHTKAKLAMRELMKKLRRLGSNMRQHQAKPVSGEAPSGLKHAPPGPKRVFHSDEPLLDNYVKMESN